MCFGKLVCLTHSPTQAWKGWLWKLEQDKLFTAPFRSPFFATVGLKPDFPISVLFCIVFFPALSTVCLDISLAHGVLSNGSWDTSLDRFCLTSIKSKLSSCSDMWKKTWAPLTSQLQVSRGHIRSVQWFGLLCSCCLTSPAGLLLKVEEYSLFV